MNINTMDLNLFLVFRAIYANRSVTVAGDRLGMTQSAASNALKRLRDRFGDPLFVRTAAGMQPTPVAQRLFVLVDAGVASFTRAIEHSNGFDPATSSRTFRIAVNDAFQHVIVPPLFSRLQQAGPGMTVEVVNAQTSNHVGRLLVDGEADVSVSAWNPMGPAFRQSRLFDDDLSVLLSKRHPYQSETLTWDEYLSADHAERQPAELLRSMVREALASNGIRSNLKVALIVPHLVGLAGIIANSWLLLTVPTRLARSMVVEHEALRIASLPFSVGPAAVRLHWHERSDGDEGLAWLRGEAELAFAAGVGLT